MRQKFVVPETLAGARVDIFLSARTGLSRSAVSSWFKQARVMQQQNSVHEKQPAEKTGKDLDCRTISKSMVVSTGDIIVVDIPEQPHPLGCVEQVAGMEILYDDDSIIVVDKPVGVAAHPSSGWQGYTVVDGLTAAGYTVSTSGAAERQGIVHRLDVGTSGLMVVAKSEQAYTELKRQFKEREVTKVYHALVQGIPEQARGTIEAPIARHPGHDWKFAVVDEGRQAITHYDTMEAFGSATLVKVHLETGRTHQIRVHFSALGHPLLGDLTYGANPRTAADLGLVRQWLHAYQLGFKHPISGERFQFQSAYPDDLNYALEKLRLQY